MSLATIDKSAAPSPGSPLLDVSSFQAKGTRTTNNQTNEPTHDAQMARNSDHTYAHDMMWDEDRGGPRTEFNLVSIPKDGDMHRAMSKAINWDKCGPHDQDRVVTPAVFIEKLFRNAPTPDPNSLEHHKILEK